MDKNIFESLANRQLQGIFFHSEMTDYYNFLTLTDLANLHHKQFIEESKNFACIKEYFIHKYHQKLNLSYNINQVIFPNEWENRTSLEISQPSLQTLVKSSMEKYYNWEKETCEFYKECAQSLFNEEEYEDYKFVRKMIDAVECEKSKIVELTLDFQSTDFNIFAIKGLTYKI